MSVPGGANSGARIDALRWAAPLGAVSADALARRSGRGIPSARGLLASAVRAGEMAAWRHLRDEPVLYTPTRTGLRAAGLSGLEPVRVSAALARHAAACCAVAAELELAFPGHLVLGEPGVRLAERESGAPFATLGGRLPGPATHRPDLLVVAPGGTPAPAAIEVELTRKSPRRLRAICRAWARSRRVCGVLYLTSPQAHDAVLRAIEAEGASARVLAVEIGLLPGLSWR